MSGPREPVPFAFVADAERFRGDVAPPPRGRVSTGQPAGRRLPGPTLVAGLVGAVTVGVPSLSTGPSGAGQQQSRAGGGR
ncbi:hypothetical protein HTV80_24010 [Streptomyces sp. Vc74B-19]|uniref:hypothetical protein n=1 Tax=unclassified Streptomyces TaxID=2593676 RepID=UPI001BFC64FE|nr:MULTISPECIES: hypothetical protein [unclassified Streptomyces]MBT3166150.1 hypothetical protein [Streptomyces sp. Vc74B-19]MCO4699859.1 hypothetical protein [Streptomyces sp. RO-S4]MDU0299509.1 hypothetical protein [Streptomyces sp. PAL114]